LRHPYPFSPFSNCLSFRLTQDYGSRPCIPPVVIALLLFFPMMRLNEDPEKRCRSWHRSRIFTTKLLLNRHNYGSNMCSAKGDLSKPA
jgi:hypothetical protein